MRVQGTRQWEDFISHLFSLAEPYLEVRQDILHTRVAHDFARRLLSMEGGEREVVEPAIILHDVGWSALDRDKIGGAYGVRMEGSASGQELNRIHEMEGARIARSILESLQFEEGLISHIEIIIGRHDSGTAPETIEEKIVKDADKLWRCSETGFWQEIERQVVDPVYFHERLIKRRPEWYITPSALKISAEEIEKRGRELKSHAHMD